MQKPNSLLAALILLPLLGLTAVGLIFFAWPVWLAAAALYLLARTFSLVRRKPRLS